MSDPSRLVIVARLEEIRHACDFVVEAAEQAGLDERAVYHCQMAVDEALTNIIEHGYAFEGESSEIEITCQADASRFLITLTDDSPAFNPLEHTAPDPVAPLDTREPGGWGIYFIRRLMDDVTYQRVGSYNRLVLTKKLPEARPAAAPAAGTGDVFPVRTLDKKTAVISPSGRLDSNTSPTLERALITQLDHGMVWIFVDMTNVEYIASSGLKILVSSWRRARDNQGDVVLSGLQPRLIEIFEMVGFDLLFQMFPDLDSALAARPQKT
ncbi:MAG: anti-sigma factor antagonist [Chloroflexi bacterium]|nr:anti-sigma factor antagonist [Chloroflexota bacterium]